MVNLACRPLVVIAHTLKKPASFCDIINGNYSITWPTVQLETWPQVRTYFYVLMRKLDLTTLADLNESIFFVSYCTWAAVFIHQQNCLLPSQPPCVSTSTDNIFKFPCAGQLTHCCASSPFSWIGFCTCFQARLPVSAVVHLMDITAVWLIDFSAGLWYALYASYMHISSC